MASSAHQAFVDEITDQVLGRISVALNAASRNGAAVKRGRPRKRRASVAVAVEGEAPKRKRGRPKKLIEEGSRAEHETVAAL